jgi:hypothetical protein
MRNLNLKPFWYLIAGVSVISLYVLARMGGSEHTRPADVLWHIPVVAAVDAASYGLFAVFIWRWKPLQGWLVPFPDLNGTWKGSISSDWEGDGAAGVEAIPVILSIRQSFGRMSCVMRTAEMESRSYAESFSIKPEDQVRRLCYSYTSRPKQSLRHRSTPHDGTALFNIVDASGELRLEGEYWTQRRTTGSVKLAYMSSEVLDSFPKDMQ